MRITKSYIAIFINVSNDQTERSIDNFIEWCEVTDGVEREGTMVYFRSDEAYVMFKLLWGN